MRTFYIVCLILFIKALSAQQLTLVICEKENQEPVFYANLLNLTAGFGSVSDFNGSCGIYYRSEKDLVRISHVGFKTQKIIIEKLLTLDTLLLERGHELKELEILDDEVKLYKDLFRVIVNSKAQMKPIDNEASILVESFLDGDIPLERFEAIGNLNYSQGKLNSFDIKMGRFGQNKSYNFFTLTPDLEIAEIKLFSYAHPIPFIITQASKNQLKKLYQLKRLIYEDYTIYSFESETGKQFSGEITVYNSSNTIAKISCHINEVPHSNLISVYAGTNLEIEQMQIEMQFSEDHKLLYLLKNQQIKLISDSRISHVDNVIFISNNDQVSKHIIPRTNSKMEKYWSIYEKTVRFPFQDMVWKDHFVFSENEKTNKSFEFFQKHGYVANIANYFSGELEEELDFNTRKWGERLDYSDFNPDPIQLGFKFKDVCFAPGFDESLVSPSQLTSTARVVYNERAMSLVNPLPDVIRFSPLICYLPREFSDSIYVEDASPLWDRKLSYFFMEKDYANMVAINLYYDWVELKMQNYVDSIGELSHNIYSEDYIFYYNFLLEKTRIKFNTYNNGLTKNYEYLVDWNESIREGLQINNFEMLTKLVMEHPEKYRLNAFIIDLSSIADIYFDRRDFKEALYFYGSALKYTRYFEVDGDLKAHIYKRLAHCYRKTDRSDLADRVEEQALKDGMEWSDQQ